MIENMRMTTKLRQLMKDGTITTVGIYDCLSAKLAQEAGFEAIHITGMGSEATLIGAPDVGLITSTEMAAHCARITAAINIPAIADIDTGFGSPASINRAIYEMERAGVAGVHIEDQADPKHCPTLGGRRVVSRDEAVDRVKIALAARTDPDFVIVARTDADCVSYEEVIERCRLFLEAGADMVMPCHQVVDGKPFGKMTPEEQMEFFRRMGKDIGGPMLGMGTGIPNGYTEKDMLDAGFRFNMYAGLPIRSVANTLLELFKEIKDTGRVSSFVSTHSGPYYGALELAELLNLKKYVQIEELYTSMK